MTEFDDFVAKELAALQRLVSLPTGALGYGLDLSCVSDISPTLEETDPNSVQGISESLLRRLQTPRGALAQIDDDSNYGFDVIGLLNNGVTAHDLRGMEAQIKAECLKDDRVADLTVTVTFAFGTGVLDVSLRITAVDPQLGTFSLIFAVDGAEILVKQVG
jgi:hypothetical protein